MSLCEWPRPEPHGLCALKPSISFNSLPARSGGQAATPRALPTKHPPKKQKRSGSFGPRIVNIFFSSRRHQCLILKAPGVERHLVDLVHHPDGRRELWQGELLLHGGRYSIARECRRRRLAKHGVPSEPRNSSACKTPNAAPRPAETLD